MLAAQTLLEHHDLIENLMKQLRASMFPFGQDFSIPNSVVVGKYSHDLKANIPIMMSRNSLNLK